MRKSAWPLAVAITLTAIGSLAGCASQPEVRYVTEPLPLPARPVLPRLSAEDVACLSEDAYRRLVERDMGRRHYAEELEAVIRSTHTEGEDGR